MRGPQGKRKNCTLRFQPACVGWPNRDPIGEHGGFNLFVFVENSAIWSIDAYGLTCVKGRKKDCVVEGPEHVIEGKTDREIIEEAKLPAAALSFLLTFAVTGGPTVPGGKAIDVAMDAVVQGIENVATKEFPNAAEVSGVSVQMVKDHLLRRKSIMVIAGSALRFTVKWKECVCKNWFWTEWVDKSGKYETEPRRRPWGVNDTVAARNAAKEQYCPEPK